MEQCIPLKTGRPCIAQIVGAYLPVLYGAIEAPKINSSNWGDFTSFYVELLTKPVIHFPKDLGPSNGKGYRTCIAGVGSSKKPVLRVQ